MKKWHLVAILSIALIVTLGASSMSPDKTENNSTYPFPKAEGGHRNLKVLPKDISDDALDSVMSEFCISLGVHCNFCHARKSDTTKKGLDFASDAKEEKGTARDMYRMTTYLNLNYFNDNHSTKPDTLHTIICYTCHHGTHEPDAKVFLTQIDSIEKAHSKNRPK